MHSWHHHKRAATLASALGFLAVVVGAAAQPDGGTDDLCSGDPCVISGDAAIDQTLVDFGSRTVVLRAILDTGDSFVTIRAGSFIIEELGQLLGTGSIDIEADGDVRVDGTRARGAVRMIGEDGGDLTVESRTGSLTGAGKLVLSANSIDGDAGSFSVDTAGDVVLTGSIEAIGGLDGGGGSIEVAAGGDVSLSGDINLSGGGFDGGSVDIVSQGSIALGPVTVDGGGELGGGGDVSLDAADDVLLDGLVQSRGSGASADDCGDGGAVAAAAGGTITVAGRIDVSARAGNCWGGDVELEASALDIRAALSLRGISGEGRGGDAFLSAARDFTCDTDIDISGNDLGGSLELRSLGDLSIGDDCSVDGGGPGGSVELEAGGELMVDGLLRVGAAAPGSAREAASIRATACSLTLGETASLQSIGGGADNMFTVAGEVLIRGSLQAGRRNALTVPPDTSPVIVGSVAPPVETTVDPQLPRCNPPGSATPSTPTPQATTPSSTPVPTHTALATSPTPSHATASPTAEAATPSATPSPTASPGECFGDCDGDGQVGIAELVRLTNIALGRDLTCASLDDGGTVGIPDLIRAVRTSLEGCS